MPPTPSTSASTRGSVAQIRGSRISACQAWRAVQPIPRDQLGPAAQRGGRDVGPQPRIVGGLGALGPVEGQRVGEHQQGGTGH